MSEDRDDETPMAKEDVESYNDIEISVSAIAAPAGARPRTTFDKVGLLVKLGANVKNWLERGFALRADYQLLYYFRTAKDFMDFAADPVKNSSRVAGTISLKNARLFVAYYVDRDHCFEISIDPMANHERHYYMYARSHADMMHWIHKLCEAGVILVSPTENLEELKALQNCKNALPPVFGMQGFMEKRGTFNRAFQKRFFRIVQHSKAASHELEYFDRFDDTKAKGSILLADSQVLADAGEAEKADLCFAVKNASRTLVLRCSNADERAQWMSSINLFIRTGNDPSPVIPVNFGLSQESKEQASASSAAAPSVLSVAPPVVVPDPTPAQAPAQAPVSAAAPAPSPASEAQPQAQAQAQAQAHAPSENGMANGAHSPAPAASAAAPAAPAVAPNAVAGLGNDGAELIKMLREEAEKKQAHNIQEREDQRQNSQNTLAEYRDTLTRGTVFVKHCRNAKPHRKLIFLSGGSLYWSDVGSRTENGEKCIAIVDMDNITTGKNTEVFSRSDSESALAIRCFSIISKRRSLDLEADDQVTRDLWVAALHALRRAV